MHSATSSDGPRLVRIEVPCTQTRVAIGMHSNERHEAPCVSRGLLSRAPEPRMKRETRSVFVGRFDVRTERECRLCSGEFE